MDKIFNWIGDLFTKIWKLFKKILPYIMIALAVFFTFGGSIILMGMVIEGYAAAIVAMGISFLVAPEETIDVTSDVAKAVGTAAGAVVAAGVGGLASGVFGGENSWLVIAAIAVGAYFLLSGNRENDGTRDIEQSTNKYDGSPVDDESVVVGPSTPSSSSFSGPLQGVTV